MANTSHVSSTSERRTALLAAAVACVFLMVAASACGASAGVDIVDQSAADTTASQDPATNDVAGDAGDDGTQAATPEPEAAQEPEQQDSSVTANIGQGNFELVLDNGDAFSAPVACVLEPQIAAGSEILFTVVGQHEGLLYDVTQWGETSFGGSQSVEIVDTTSFETLWRSTGSTGLILELDGNVVSGSGGFYQGEDLNGPKTQGDLTVTC